MTNEKKKKVRTSAEIAIEITEDQKEYDNAVEESKRAIELEVKRLKNAIEHNEHFKRKIVQRIGKLLERSGLVRLNRISTKITNDFRGYISRDHIMRSVDPRWKRPYTTPKDHGRHSRKQNNQAQNQNNQLSEPEQQPLTQQELDYIKAHEDEFKRMHIVDELIELWTGKSFAEQSQISHDTPKGTDWRKKLIEESRDHMIKLSKQMTDSYVNGTLNDMRLIGYITNAFGDILYEERELRDKKSKIEGV
jgi:hypothetical protein